MKKPFLFAKPFYSSKECHLFSNPANIAKARKQFLKHRPSSLVYLLEKRYSWMNNFIKSEDIGIELGCGTGLSKLFIKSKNFIITDFIHNEWIDKKIDAMKMQFNDNSLDYIIASNVIHHLAKPYFFMEECTRVLKKRGKIIIQEAHTSLLLRILLKLKDHEGFSYDMDVFNKGSNFSSSEDPWACNIAIPSLLFDDREQFESNFPFKIIHNIFTECLLWPLSGGIAPVGKQINLPRSILKVVDIFDSILIALSKDIFALQRQTVLENMK